MEYRLEERIYGLVIVNEKGEIVNIEKERDKIPPEILKEYEEYKKKVKEEEERARKEEKRWMEKLEREYGNPPANWDERIDYATGYRLEEMWDEDWGLHKSDGFVGWKIEVEYPGNSLGKAVKPIQEELAQRYGYENRRNLLLEAENYDPKANALLEFAKEIAKARYIKVHVKLSPEQLERIRKEITENDSEAAAKNYVKEWKDAEWIFYVPKEKVKP